MGIVVGFCFADGHGGPLRRLNGIQQSKGREGLAALSFGLVMGAAAPMAPPGREDSSKQPFQQQESEIKPINLNDFVETQHYTHFRPCTPPLSDDFKK